MNNLEQLHVNDNIDLVEKINNLQEQLRLQESTPGVCIKCEHNYPSGSIYCIKCGNKIVLI
jgi:hypothetical protein